MHENTHNFNLGEDQTNGKYRYKGKVTQSNRYSIDRQYWKVDRLGSSFCMIWAKYKWVNLAAVLL